MSDLGRAYGERMALPLQLTPDDETMVLGMLGRLRWSEQLWLRSPLYHAAVTWLLRWLNWSLRSLHERVVAG